MAPPMRNPFSMTCCFRALLEDLSYSHPSRSSHLFRARSIGIHQVRAFTATSRTLQYQSDPDFGGEDGAAPAEDLHSDRGSLAAQSRKLRASKKAREENFEMPEGGRFVPASASYFTGNAAFYDNWLALQDLLLKYQALPTVSPQDAPRSSWRSLSDYRSIAGAGVQASKYKKVQNILTRLNQIEPGLIPPEVQNALDLYRRPDAAEQIKPKPRYIDRWGRARGMGRRKEASAEAWVVEGEGGVFVNGQSLVEVFPRLHDRESVLWPLKVTNRINKYNVWATTQGGGVTGQAESVTLAVARALLVHEPLLKPVLRRAGCVTRDPRTVERKKHGKLKARKMPAWVAR